MTNDLQNTNSTNFDAQLNSDMTNPPGAASAYSNGALTGSNAAPSYSVIGGSNTMGSGYGYG